MITITPSAQSQILESIKQRGSGLGIRLGIKTAGCSGLKYVLEYVDHIFDEDTVFRCEGFSLVVIRKHTPILDGMTIDYVQKGLNAGFETQTPLDTARCGCRESFQI